MNAQDELVAAEAEVTRARAAAAEERKAEDKKALKAAIARGRELSGEYNRIESSFKEADARVRRGEATRRQLAEREAFLIGSEPNAVLDFPEEEDQERWERELAAVLRERDELNAESRIDLTLRESYRLGAINAASALDNQRQVVRNLREKIEDPEGERLRTGNVGGVGGVGGVFVPLGGRVF
jgi:hypothetical protein